MPLSSPAAREVTTDREWCLLPSWEGDVMKALKIAGAAVLAAILALAGFLAWRVIDARARTPGLIGAIVAKADPQVVNLPKARVDAYLAVEDPTFWTNDGIDETTPGAGMTTTTQGLGKLLYFKRFRGGPWNKLQLMLIAKFAMTPKATKRDILIAALSTANMGEARGFPAAARRYYGRELSALTDDQFLGLVAMPVAPNDLDPLGHPAANAERVRRIKRLLAHACRPTGLNDVMLEGCR